MNYPFRLSPASLLAACFLFTACGTYNNEPLWNEATTYFTNPSTSKEEIFQKLSPEAIRSLIGAYPVEDSAVRVVEFFDTYKDNHNYAVERYADTVRIEFNPQKKIAGGPLVYLLYKGPDWKVIEIVFGK